MRLSDGSRSGGGRRPDYYTLRGRAEKRLAAAYATMFRSEGNSPPCSLSRDLPLPGFPRQLRSVPACDHPDRLTFPTVEKTIRRKNQLAKGKVRKLSYESAGLRISREPAKGTFSSLPKSDGGQRIVAENIGDCLEKLDSRGGGEAEFHVVPPVKSASASARISSKSNPFAAAISRSPSARRCRRWRSCSPRS